MKSPYPVFDSPEHAAAFDLVVIAASLGGRPVLEQVLAPLPADFPVPIVVVMHVSADSPGYIPILLGRRTRLAVAHAADGEALRPGRVHVAPPARHVRVTRDGTLALDDGPRVSHARPSADVLFASAAEAAGPRTIGVVLTGRLYDGALGAAAIRAAGGVVLAQDPATCRAPDMPRAAMRRGAVHLSLPPESLASALVALATVPGLPAVLGLGRRAAA